MKIGTIIFTWHRSEHTAKVLEALAQNDLRPQRLYIFQDGMNEKTNAEEWEKVNSLIKQVNFCETHVQVSGINKGCAKSIVTGINYVLEECDAVIILEDDCVPNRQFMRFMVSALETYKSVEKVYSISGYTDGVKLSREQNYDAFFSGRSCSWGWGTWKDKWAIYEENYNIINEIKKDKKAYERLQVWGIDLEEMLMGNISGKCNAWDVFWSLNIIKRGGYCLSPYEPLIHNIGCDGTGVHCGYRRDNDEKEMDFTASFRFPQIVRNTEECENEVRFIFGGKQENEKRRLYQDILIRWVKMKQEGKSIKIPIESGKNVVVWGKGKIFDLLADELGDYLNIKCIVEREPNTDEYRHIPVITVDEIPKNIMDIIVIPFFDIDIISPKVKKKRPDIRIWGMDELIN